LTVARFNKLYPIDKRLLARRERT